MARSGTTLLRLQLDAHPELAIPAETGFGALLARLDGRVPSRAELLDSIAALPTWRDLGVSREELHGAFDDVEDWSTGAGVRAYYRLYAGARGKGRYGDKTPEHALHMETLSRSLPEARFIHIIRDGRDVATSLRDMPFAPARGDIRAIASMWRDTVWRARRAGIRVSHYTEVRYEQLVTEPERVLRELCDFLELGFYPAMLEAHERAEERLAEMRSVQVLAGGSVRLGDGSEIETRTTRPPDPARAGRWRAEMPQLDVARFERLAGGALRFAGYEAYEHPAKAAAARIGRGGRTPPMRIVLGRSWLVSPGGTETYMLTVARELDRLGHDVTIATEQPGAIADVARSQGTRVVSVGELSGDCDAILAHDRQMATALAERLPDARLVCVAHSDTFDLQLPPLSKGIVDAVVACSDRMAARVRAAALDCPIYRLREPVDTDAYLVPAPLPARPRRALIMSSYLRGARRDRLVGAWERSGIECVHVGAPENIQLDPRPEMSKADIVVGKARAVLEAMCCGRAVYVYDQYGSDGWVTADSYPAFEADHFAGQATPAPREPADLIADLAAYDPQMGVTNAELVRTHHGARRHAMELVAILRGEHAHKPDGTEPLAELAQLARASSRAEARVWEAWRRAEIAEQDRVIWQERAGDAEHELERARLLLATKRARAGLAVGRAADWLRGRS